MIGRLRRKFVFAAMLALFIVLALLIGVINVLNYRSMIAEADDTLNLLAESGGAFPDRVGFFSDPRGGFGHGRGFNGETIFQSRYFSVLIDANGTANAVNLRNVDLGDNEWVNDIRTQTDRLASLTNDLIYLSRMEEEGAKPQMLDFPLSDVISDTAAPFSAIAKTKNRTFTMDVQPMLTLHGDEKSIRKLISILLDNAMKYTPDDGDVVLSAKRSAKQIRLSVYNTAEGMEKGSRDRLFDRFYRADASRNSETGGFGLGLAVAKAVTEAHGGKIHASSPDGNSLVVEALFPA